MNILMVTNTYTPHVGGVARSVAAFSDAYRARGHRVLVIAPTFEGVPPAERDVVRVPAIQHFNGSDFSVRLPIPALVNEALAEFDPDIVHSHHPFLLGDTALRIAAAWNVPLVFTHHTMYEQYTHYVPGDSPALQRFVIDLASGYANLCDQVFAPSDSVASVLRERGVETPISVVPTGVDVLRFAEGDGQAFRREHGIPQDATVVGHLGRLAPEKNLAFLAVAVANFLKRRPHAHFLVVGAGPSASDLRERFAEAKLSERLHLVGILQKRDLIDAYHAMDVFAFASQSETQGMVLTEAMAAGVPVVAVDAPGAREVVHGRQNGRLLPSEKVTSFAKALAEVADAKPEVRRSMREAALATAQEFSMPHQAERALAVYESLIAGSPTPKATQDSLWETSLRLIETEWDLWTNLAHAAGAALEARHWLKIPLVAPLLLWWRRTRRWLSRTEWGVRLFGLPRSVGTSAEPGLLLVQIDGLSRSQFETALHHRRLPFLRRLMTRDHYRLHTLYSGLPSSTPAFQGELFYGVKGVVPGFSFREHRSGRVVRMVDPEPAARVQRRLGKLGRGLLQGGSAYSDIYSGGATESHFCPSTWGWGHLLQAANPFAWLLFIVAHTWSFVRIAVLLAAESVLAVVDCLRGMYTGQDLMKELKFVPTRVGICILLRELLTVGASMDAARGLPVIHLNLLGYDEQAHRRGPSSVFAHWSLRGIDNAIRRMWYTARRSTRRDYQIWIYSDHGQEFTLPYPDETGTTLEEAVAKVFDSAEEADRREHPPRGVQFQRASWLGRAPIKRPPADSAVTERVTAEGKLTVTAMGPLGFIYPPSRLSEARRRDIAARLVTEARVPLVFYVDDDQVVWAQNGKGRFHLPAQAEMVLGPEHPFLPEVAEDLVNLCRHPDAGELITSGWRPGERSISFPFENGAHCGPGPEETRAFALLPHDAPIPDQEKKYLRPLDLREAALVTLKRIAPQRPVRKRRRRPGTLRIMTYNVHSCIGTDGRLSPARIARVIAQYDPDVVALQELDVGRPQTGEIDQAHAIAQDLEMEFHFHPALAVEEELYGDAVLSRLPMRLVRASALPRLANRPYLEPRGALWVAINVDDSDVQLVNTHLSLSPKERSQQVSALLGSEWLSHADCRTPAILCGDFNALPRSRGYRKLCGRLQDAQRVLKNHRPKRTWFPRMPLGRIDHVFVSPDVEVTDVQVPRTHLTRVASDHLPLIVDVKLA